MRTSTHITPAGTHTHTHSRTVGAHTMTPMPFCLSAVLYAYLLTPFQGQVTAAHPGVFPHVSFPTTLSLKRLTHC